MSRNSMVDLYETLFQLLKSKPHFEYTLFFDYIYGKYIKLFIFNKKLTNLIIFI